MIVERGTDAAGTGSGWIRRLLARCFRHPRTAFGALTVTMIAAVIDISFPLLTRIAVDDATAGDGDAIAAVALAIGALGLVRFACQFGRRWLAGRLSIDVQHDLRLDLLTSLQRLDGRKQDEIRTGQVVSRSITDLQLVQGLLAMVPLSAGAVLQFVLALAVMAYLSPLLTVVAVLIVPAVSLVVYRIRPVLFAATWSAQQRPRTSPSTSRRPSPACAWSKASVRRPVRSIASRSSAAGSTRSACDRPASIPASHRRWLRFPSWAWSASSHSAAISRCRARSPSAPSSRSPPTSPLCRTSPAPFPRS